MAHDRLCLEPLRRDQYRQVAEWEWGPQPVGTDWAKYEAEMDAPEWAHFGLYDGADFRGCISLEDDHGTVVFHVVTARKKIRSHALAQVLLKMAGKLFSAGHTALATRIPNTKERRAAAVLALRCGMREWGHTPEVRYFILTKQRYLKYGIVKTQADADAVSKH